MILVYLTTQVQEHMQDNNLRNYFSLSWSSLGYYWGTNLCPCACVLRQDTQGSALAEEKIWKGYGH